MGNFVEFEIETNEDALVELYNEAMEAEFPGWASAPGSYEDWLARIWARIATETAELAVDVPPEIFYKFGTSILNIPPIEASGATALTTWTMRDNAGYTVPAGTLISIQKTGSDLIGFEVVNEFSVPPGNTSIADVPVVAAEPGAYANDATGPATMLDALVFVLEVELQDPTSNGTDAESPDDYLGRLRDELQLLSPRPILPVDAETLVKRIAGIDRALALDLYDPSDGLYTHARTVTIAVADSEGEAVAGGLKTAAEDLLELHREINFVFHVIDPTYTTIKVEYGVTPLPGFDQSSVNANVAAAITAYLEPGRWGYAGGVNQDQKWSRSDNVYINELIALADRTTGVDRVVSMRAAKQADALGTAPVALTQPAALTRPGAITVAP